MASRKADDFEQIVNTKPQQLWLVYQQPQRKYASTFNTTLVFVRADSAAAAIREAKALHGDMFAPAGLEHKRPRAMLVTNGLSLFL